MSGPQRQQLADVATVTPTLSDKAVTIQAGKVKTSLYSAIYNLFKSGFDLIYLKASDLTNYATKSYTDNAANSAVVSANEYTDTQVDSRQLDYDLSKVATGTTTVTINSDSGVATFTQSIIRKTSVYLEVNNTQIEAGDLIEHDLRYEGVGYPLIMHYRTEESKIRFHFANIAVDGGGGIDTDSDLVVTFRKI